MEEIKHILKEKFGFPKTPLIASVATPRPNIRSMRIFDFNRESPILLSHKESTKWKEWERDPEVALQLVSDDKMLQVVARGQVELCSGSQKYWEMMRTDIKEIYDLQYRVEATYQKLETLQIVETVPETFGMVRVIPNFWEVLILTERYVESERTQFHKTPTGWEARRINVS